MNKDLKIAILIFLAALAVRVAYIEQSKSSPLFYYPIVDSGAYENAAARAAKEPLTLKAFTEFHKVPSYRLFVTAIYKCFGRNIYAVRFAQAVLGAFDCSIIFLLGAGIFKRKAGLLAGIIAVFYWPLIAFSCKILPVNLAVFFSLLAIYVLHKFTINPRSVILCFLCGVFLSLAYLSRGNVILLFPAFIFVIIFGVEKQGHPAKHAWPIIWFLLGAVIILGPSVSREFGQTGELSLVHKNFGLASFIGMDLKHLDEFRPGSEDRINTRLKEEGAHTPAERNRYWIRQSRLYLARETSQVMRTYALKAYLLLNAYEFSPEENINAFKTNMPFLRLPLIGFGCIAAFSILGLLLSGREAGRRALVIDVFFVVYFVSLLPFLPLSRFRLPLAPAAIILSSFFIVRFFERVKNRQWGDVAVAAALSSGFIFFTCTNPLKVTLEGYSRFEYYRGLVLLQKGDPAGAVSDLRRALSLHPNDDEIAESLGDACYKAGEYREAVISYIRASAIGKREDTALIEKTGIALAESGDINEAKLMFNRVIRLTGDTSRSAHINLGNCFFLDGDYVRAEDEYRIAVAIDPQNPQALYRLASFYKDLGRPEYDEIMQRFNAVSKK
ncbi:MAG: tetratricopeptide repeat protein [Candidatus Omnitrophica bacterium]|nr:tetratricopeptide repeat protein [Candidatus Omnitrophota bacterium]